MKIFLLDTYISLTHSSLGLQYIRGCALQDKELNKCLEIKIQSLPIKFLTNITNSKFIHARILEEIIDFRPDIIGLSCYVWSLKEFLNLSQFLKVYIPGVKIILGGPEVSFFPIAKEILTGVPGIDFIIMGEGEITFQKIIKLLLGKQTGSIADIPGITFRKSSTEIVDGGYGEILDNIDDIPSPYLNGTFSLASECILMETYRGCLNKCSYCSWSVKKHRRFNMKRIISELDVLIDCEMPFIYLIDSVFGPNRKRCEQILNFIIQKTSRQR